MPIDRRKAAAAIDTFLLALGRDPSREPELVGAGERVAQAFADDLCRGYDVDIAALFARSAIPKPMGKTEVVILRDIAITTTCPHHLMPASGFAHVAFAPRGRLMGLGAIVELVDAFSQRLTLQETVSDEVADAIMTYLEPVWSGCRVVLAHSCMTARGERRHGARAETYSLVGSPNADDRAEALAALGVGR